MTKIEKECITLADSSTDYAGTYATSYTLVNALLLHVLYFYFHVAVSFLDTSRVNVYISKINFSLCIPFLESSLSRRLPYRVAAATTHSLWTVSEFCLLAHYCGMLAPWRSPPVSVYRRCLRFTITSQVLLLHSNLMLCSASSNNSYIGFSTLSQYLVVAPISCYPL